MGKFSLKSVTYLKYEAICGSLAWYSPVTCLVINNESLFTNKLRVPSSLANNIPATKASYSAWLLMALKANLRACSINSPLDPSTEYHHCLLGWLLKIAYHEISIYLALDRPLGFVLYVELKQLDCPTYHLTCYIGLLEDLADWEIDHYYHHETLEMGAQLPSYKYHF